MKKGRILLTMVRLWENNSQRFLSLELIEKLPSSRLVRFAGLISYLVHSVISIFIMELSLQDLEQMQSLP